MGKYKIVLTDSDPEIEMEGTFSLDELQNIHDEADEMYRKQYGRWYRERDEDQGTEVEE